MSLWYEHLKQNIAKELKSKIKTWSKLKKQRNKRILLSSYNQELYLKITSLSQENLKVEDYIRELEQLQIRVGLNKEPVLKIARFIKGLSPDIVNKLDLQPYLSFDNGCNLKQS